MDFGRRKTRRWFGAALAVGAMLQAGAASAQDFPVKGKLITIIVPFAAGGVTDTGGRLMAEALGKELDTSVQIVNRVGAGSQVGLTELVRAAPDGYTLSYVTLPTVVTHYLSPDRTAPYTRTSFQPVANHHYSPQVMAVRADSRWTSLKEFVEEARAKPGRITIGDAGLLGATHLQTLMLGRAAGVEFNAVHFGGGAQSVTATLGGHVDAMSGSTADALVHKASGTFRIIGVSAEKPDRSMPDAPTFVAQGYDVILASWIGLVAPAGTPQNVVDVLSGAIRKIIATPEHTKKLQDIGLEAAYLAPDAYSRLWVDVENRVRPLLEVAAGKK